jgi:sterol desaturase/sphingolipid hydroxylase (fatty acid hydroxylase superfamily)
MADERKSSTWGALAIAGGFCALLWREHRRRLRAPAPEPEPKSRRLARNLALAGLTAATISLAERPLVEPLAQRVERRRWGLLPRLNLPRPLEGMLALLLMDYSLYWWHVLLHRLPPLWRLHTVHHTDLELDVSTTARFHFAEFIASVPWRAAQVVLIGVRPHLLALWQRATLAEVMFHHSNVRLPLPLERVLCRLVVTPRLHGIHHSIVPAETNANFSSGLTVWDYLHATLRLNVPQETITIGVAGYDDPARLTLPRLLILPLKPQPKLPPPQRAPSQLLAPRRLAP